MSHAFKTYPLLDNAPTPIITSAQAFNVRPQRARPDHRKPSGQVFETMPAYGAPMRSSAPRPARTLADVDRQAARNAAASPSAGMDREAVLALSVQVAALSASLVALQTEFASLRDTVTGLEGGTGE
jgi:hypothetical protein